MSSSPTCVICSTPSLISIASTSRGGSAVWVSVRSIGRWLDERHAAAGGTNLPGDAASAFGRRAAEDGLLDVRDGACDCPGRSAEQRTGGPTGDVAAGAFPEVLWPRLRRRGQGEDRRPARSPGMT